MVKETEYYDTLGLASSADENEIKRAYKKLALRYHPDKNHGDNEAVDKFKQLGEAYEVLGDPDKRRFYDTYGKQGLEQTDDTSAEDVFSMFFGGSRQKGEPKPKDIVHELQVTLENIYNGKTKKVAVNRDRLCTTCSGRGTKSTAKPRGCQRCAGSGHVLQMCEVFMGMPKPVRSRCSKCMGSGTCVSKADLCNTCQGLKVVKERKVLEVVIEKGVKPNSHIRFTGEGDQCLSSQSLIGDIIIFFIQKPHDVFRRVGDHLIFTHEVSLVEALCGFEIPLEQLDQRMLLIKIRRGQIVDKNHVYCVTGEGMPKEGTGGVVKGDMMLVFTVQMPTISTQKARQELAAAFKYDPDASLKDIPSNAVDVRLEEFAQKNKARRNRKKKGDKGKQMDPGDITPKQMFGSPGDAHAAFVQAGVECAHQ